ncbi:MAG: UPF0280 family protein [Methanosarcinales archaeon]|jgi:ApbE superfamily uncharacterized protein (UPF0280 family)|nr:UPF0280 family protein [Methanosarcinales archaeon]
MYQKAHFQFKQTIVTILADKAEYIDAAKTEIIKCRLIIEDYIAHDPFFEATFEAYDMDETAPPLIRKMIQAGNTFDIGPMSTVAGTIAGAAVEKMKMCGASFALVDNGGDIAVYNKTDRPVVIGVYAGAGSVQNLGFSLAPSDKIIGICTSSGTVGPSVSFGKADAAIIFSQNPSLADSAATALGNALKEQGKESIEKALSAFSNISGIDGAVLIQGNDIGFAGNIPRLVNAHIDYDIITKG